VVLALCVGLVVLIAASAGSGGRARARAPRHPARAAPGLRVSVASAGTLPSPTQDAAGAQDAASSGVLLAGGLGGEEASSAQVLLVNGGTATVAGTLPTPLHDACAAQIGGVVYVFGGGEQSSFSAIVALRPGEGAEGSGSLSAEQAGTLPTPASDVACAVIGGTVYVVGGYTGQEPLRSILAWQPGTSPHPAGTLPKPLRYAAVAPVAGKVLIAGGTSGSEASRDVYSFDPATGAVRRVGGLPFGVTHAAGAALDGQLLVIGGREAAPGSQHTSILAVSPSGRVTVAGRLPLALSDAAAVASAGGVLVAGGSARDGSAQGQILKITASG
jgi:N-acetylneuraminic acid mutarotase